MDPNQQQNQQKQQQNQQKGGGQAKDGLSVSSNFSYQDNFNVREVLSSAAVNASAYVAGTVFAAAIGPVIARTVKGMWSLFSGNKNIPAPVQTPNIREQIGRICATDPAQAESILRQIQGSLARRQEVPIPNAKPAQTPDIPVTPETKN